MKLKIQIIQKKNKKHIYIVQQFLNFNLKLFILMFIISISLQVKSQLNNLHFSDSKKYKDSLGYTVYPTINFKTEKNNIYYKNNLIFNKSIIPNKYDLFIKEIYNNEYLFITFIDSVYIYNSDPNLFKRYDVYIIKLDTPINIYSFNFEGKYIIENWHSKLENYNFEIYEIKNLTKQKIILKDINNNLVEKKLDCFKNQLIKL